MQGAGLVRSPVGQNLPGVGQRALFSFYSASQKEKIAFFPVPILAENERF